MISRSHHQKCPVRKGVLRNLAKFTGKHLCQGLSFKVFFCEFRKISKNTFSYKIPLGDCFWISQHAFSKVFLFQYTLQQFQYYDWSLWHEIENENMKHQNMNMNILEHFTKSDTSISCFPADIYLSIVNNGNTRIMYEICSMLTIRAPEWRQFLFIPCKTWENLRFSDVFRGSYSLTLLFCCLYY